MQLLPSVDVARRKEKFLRIAAAAAAAARVGCMGRPVFTPPPSTVARSFAHLRKTAGFLRVYVGRS